MTALRATILIAFFAILSKLLGLVRWMVFSNRFGSGELADIYFASFRLPDLFFNLLILGTLSAAFIPVFVRYLNQDRKEALLIASTVFNLTLVAMAALSLVGFFLAEPIVNLIVPGFDAEAKALTAKLTKIFMLSPLIFSLSSVLTSILHAQKRFLIAATAPLLYNFSIIFGIIWAYPRFGFVAIVWAGIVGAALHFVIQLPQALKAGLRPFRQLALSHPGIKKIGKLFAPRIFAIELGQIGLFVATILGSDLPEGSITSYNYAFDLQMVALGVFAIPFAVASFPYMADYFSRGQLEKFRQFFSQTIVQMLFLIIPISVLMLLLRAQLVRLVFGAGENTAFDFAATRLTAQALGFFVLAMFAQSLVPLLVRAFYALENTIIPVLTWLASSVLFVAMAIGFSKTAGAAGIALAFSISSVVQTLVLLAILHRRVGNLGDEFVLTRVLKIGVASVMMSVAAYISLYLVAPLVNMQTYLGVLSQTLATLLVAAITYLLAGLLVRLPETRQLVGIVRTWFFKFSRPLTSAMVNMFTDFK